MPGPSYHGRTHAEGGTDPILFPTVVDSIDGGAGGPLTGDVTFSEGGDVTLTQVGQDIKIGYSPPYARGCVISSPKSITSAGGDPNTTWLTWTAIQTDRVTLDANTKEWVVAEAGLYQVSLYVDQVVVSGGYAGNLYVNCITTDVATNNDDHFGMVFASSGARNPQSISAAWRFAGPSTFYFNYGADSSGVTADLYDYYMSIVKVAP